MPLTGRSSHPPFAWIPRIVQPQLHRRLRLTGGFRFARLARLALQSRLFRPHSQFEFPTFVADSLVEIGKEPHDGQIADCHPARRQRGEELHARGRVVDDAEDRDENHDSPAERPGKRECGWFREGSPYVIVRLTSVDFA